MLAFEKILSGRMVDEKSMSPHSVHRPGITVSEMMCVEILDHHSGYKRFEYYIGKKRKRASWGRFSHMHLAI